MIDAGPLGKLSMELMEGIESQFGDEAVLVTAIVAVEVSYKDEDGDDAFSFQWADNGVGLGAKRGLVEYVRDGLTYRR